jgi:hypothetical protein
VSPWAAPLPALAALLGWAGLAKVARPHDTARALRQAGLPGAGGLVRAGAGLEAAVAVWFLASGGRLGAALVGVSYGLFAVYVSWALLSGAALSSCGCFGEPDTPPTWAHAGLCAAAAVEALAGAAGTFPLSSLTGALSGQPLRAVPFIVLSAAAAYGAYLLMAAAPRLSAARRLFQDKPVP